MQKYLDIYTKQLHGESDELFFKNTISSFYYSYSHMEIAFIKNTTSHYVAVSSQFAALRGLEPHELIGKLDFEIPDKISEFAQIFYQQDREVEASRKKRRFLDVHYYADGLGIYVFRKAPIINPSTNNALGIYCVASKFKGKSSMSVVQLLAKEPVNRQCNLDICMGALTRREQEVLFCVANGLTDRKLIARFLSAIHGKEIGADATIKNILKSLYNKIPCGSTISSLANYGMIRKCHTFIPESIMTAEHLAKGVSIPFD